MKLYEKSLLIMNELFGRDYQFALATSVNNMPSVRFVDTFYYDGSLYLVTDGKSKKVKDIEINPNVSLCNKQYRFNGMARNIGHPLEPKNAEIREKLLKAFELWYFKHNDENDKDMCYIKIELSSGFFYKDGTGYLVDFINHGAEEFPFEFDIVIID